MSAVRTDVVLMALRDAWRAIQRDADTYERHAEVQRSAQRADDLSERDTRDWYRVALETYLGI